MRNTLIMHNVPVKLLLATKEISKILKNNLELNQDVCDSVSKLITLKMDEIIRMAGFTRKDNLVQTISEILAK